MKKALIYILLLLSFNTMAQIVGQGYPNQNNPYSTSLTIIGERNQNFWLFIDDVLQNENPVNSIQVNGFEMKDYYVRIEIDNQLHNCFGQYVNISRSRIFEIEREDGFYGMEAESYSNVRPQLTINLIVAGNNQGYYPNQGNYPNQGYGNVPPQNGGMLPPPPGMPMGMNPQEFAEAKAMIEQENFDSSKLTVAKQVVEGGHLTASQITEICRLFSFESNALELAKYAYPYCIDPGKYFLVNQAFEYDSSKQELNRLIGGR